MAVEVALALGRPDGRRAVRAQLQRRARHRSGLPPRRRAARRIRSVRPQPRRRRGARLHRPAADARCGRCRASRRRRSRARCRSTSTACRCAASRSRGARRSDAAPERALSNIVTAGLFQDDGHSAAQRDTTSRRSRMRRDAAAGDRQRGVRAAVTVGDAEPLGRRLESRDRQLRDRRRRAQLTQRFVRREAGAGHLFLLPRSAVGRRADPPAHPAWQRDAARTGGRARGARARSDAAGLRRPNADRSRRQEPVPRAAFRRGCSSCSDR